MIERETEEGGVQGRFAASSQALRFRSRDPHCSFCFCSIKNVKWLIEGPLVYICSGCVSVCNEIISEAEAADRLAQKDKAPEVKDEP